MKKEILDKELYQFDASSNTISFDNSISLNIVNLLLVTNVTDNVIIYNFACEGHGGELVNNVLTLDYQTDLMSDNDDLQIVVVVKETEVDQVLIGLTKDIKASVECLQSIAELLRFQNELIKELL